MIIWFCPNCQQDSHPIFNGKDVAGCITCGAEMIPRKAVVIALEDSRIGLDGIQRVKAEID